jgi:hypothetical protein
MLLRLENYEAYLNIIKDEGDKNEMWINK